ncbi:MAG: adenylyl-sulfate kinase [Firmicutes bacterium]|nr:adenylyl-sulfate kinase [Bacillota bacterium]
MEHLNKQDENMNIVIVGHVDHGKSTIIGRLLADTNSLPEGKLEQVKETCRRNSKPFEYAFLLDALKDEQSQGITIDSARVFFNTKKRNYIIIDAPGHIEFLKNMVTGASRAESALLVIDANEGIKENSKRHGYMLSMLGIKQVSVLVNKMDLVDYDEDTYKNIVKEYTKFLEKIDIKPESFIPVSGMMGDAVASLSDNMPWYEGQTVLESLDNFKTKKEPENRPFRMPVQDVYKFTKDGDNRRIVAGNIESGKVSVGDEVVFYPSGKSSKVKSIEGFNREKTDTIGVGYATGFTLEEQIYIKRGELASIYNQKKPKVSSRIKTNLFWLGRKPMKKGKEYKFKVGTSKVIAKIEEITRVIDASDLSNAKKESIDRHDVAECILTLDKAIAFDEVTDIDKTSRFVIVDDYEIAGGGIIQKALEDDLSEVRDKVMLRNYKWEKSIITKEERAEKYNQKSSLILITGKEDVGKKPLAKTLEKKLFNDGKIVYFLGIGNLLYGVDADIKATSNNNKEEHLRRLAEVANIILDSGSILIVTAVGLTKENLDTIKTSIDTENIQTVWVGDEVTTNIPVDIQITDTNSLEAESNRIKGLLQKEGIIFKPW